MDEGREDALIQLLEMSVPPERKNEPKRAFIAIAATLLSLLPLGMYILVRHFWRESATDPNGAEKMARLRAAFGRRCT